MKSLKFLSIVLLIAVAILTTTVACKGKCEKGDKCCSKEMKEGECDKGDKCCKKGMKEGECEKGDKCCKKGNKEGEGHCDKDKEHKSCCKKDSTANATNTTADSTETHSHDH